MARYDPRYREAGVLFVMKKGAVLHREIQCGTERFWLSNGVNVRTAVAHAVITHPSIRPSGDDLFGESNASQTFYFQNPS